MIRRRNHTVVMLFVALLVYIGVIVTLVGYIYKRGRNMSERQTTNALQTIALNVENQLYVMNQYAGTFLSAFGSVQMQDDGFSRVVFSTDGLKDFSRSDCERALSEFVSSNQLILGAFFCFEEGVYGPSAYQPYFHRNDTLIRQMKDIYPFTSSDLFRSVREHRHNWWHAGRHKTAYGDAALGCCMPLYLNDTAHFIGVFVMDYSLDSLGAYLRSVRPFPSSELYIINSLDYIISETDSLYYGQSISSVPEWDTSNYGTYLESFSYLPWHLAMVTPQQEVYAYQRSLMGWILLIAVVGLVLLVICIWYVVRAVLRSASERESMASELHMAATIQRALLPASLPAIPGVTLDALLRPAKEVAGDLYDVGYENDYFYFIVGDVSGKGFQASLMMSLISGMFRMRVHEQLSPCQIMNLLNVGFSERNAAMLFCTVLIGRIHVPSGEMLLCNAGHNLPILNGRFVDLPAGLPIGVETSIHYEDVSFQLHANDSLYCYTDGVTEAENSNHLLFGDNRLLSLCTDGASLSEIEQSIDSFAAGYAQSDDITMLSLTFNRFVARSIQDIEGLHDYINFQLSTFNIELSIEEAIVNSLTHGNATYVSLAFSPSRPLASSPIFALITDDGIPFDPTTAPLPAVKDELGGQGLNLIRQIATSMHYERVNNHNVLTLEFSNNEPIV